MIKTTITVTATVELPCGARLFQSSHTSEGIHEEPASHFAGLITPIEKILSDAHRKFLPTDEEAAADQE
jgi:hypothetical protein